MRITSWIAVLLMPVPLAACATDEWLFAKSECDYQAILKYPVQYEQRNVTKSRQVAVPDGYTCTTRKNGSRDITDCRPKNRYIYESYQVVESVDINQDVRDRYATDCANKLCVQRYGNPDCETPQNKTQ